MPAEPTRFDDGAAYERTMGAWSQLVGREFLDWLAPCTGQRWIDVGCGNGAFTELILDRAAPSDMQGVDPSAGQISYASARAGTKAARFQIGDALALPFDDASFDFAVMALVIFFVPAPTHGVDEMVRVVRPGGRVAAYAWDMLEGGFPLEPMQAEMRARAMTPSSPPFAGISGTEALQRRWMEAGLSQLEQRSFTVSRTFASFNDFWGASTATSSMKARLVQMPEAELAAFKAGVRARLPAASDGSISYTARANAIQGVKPA